MATRSLLHQRELDRAIEHVLRFRNHTLAAWLRAMNERPREFTWAEHAAAREVAARKLRELPND